MKAIEAIKKSFLKRPISSSVITLAFIGIGWRLLRKRKAAPKLFKYKIPKQLPTGGYGLQPFDPTPIATRLYTSMEGYNWGWRGNLNAISNAWEELSNLNAGQMTMVYNAYSQIAVSKEDELSLTQRIRDEGGWIIDPDIKAIVLSQLDLLGLI